MVLEIKALTRQEQIEMLKKISEPGSTSQLKMESKQVLEKMNVHDLRQLAIKHKINVMGLKTKRELITKLTKKHFWGGLD